MKCYETDQENFWSGKFGDDYVDRNSGKAILALKTGIFARMLRKAERIKTSLEPGSNIGLNEKALQRLFPDIQMDVVEINEKAANECRKIENVNVHLGSILEFATDKTYDLTFSCGVMIHISPEKLPVVYRCLHGHSKKYILVSEYYNPTPVEVTYRGHSDRLFKRDFAGEMLDMFPDLHLIDYGFIYHRDPSFPADDGTYFLMEKR